MTSFTGIPVLWMETLGRKEITSKEEYLDAMLRLDYNNNWANDWDNLKDVKVQVKGRGNTTWDEPKKPYRLKFEEKQSLFSEQKDKSWNLLANYEDKTMLRNRAALWLGYQSCLEWTPKTHFVELMLNGRYNGTYELTEKIKVAGHRVNVGDDGFLLEVDIKAPNDEAAKYFIPKNLDHPVEIKEPEVEYGDENNNYIQNFVFTVDSVLYSADFTNTETGWQKYLDIDSFVDFYLLQEISKNIDGAFHASCWMNMKRGGKLKMGPLWDFDRAFGNCIYENGGVPDGFYVKNYRWFKRLFEDPLFVIKVKERFAYFYNRKDELLKHINEDAENLHYAAIENNNKWSVLYNVIWPNYDVWGNYQNEVQSMKEWIVSRLDWMKREYDNM